MRDALAAKKRGGGRANARLLAGDGGAWALDERLLAVDEALTRLEAPDSRAAEVYRTTALRRPHRD